MAHEAADLKLPLSIITLIDIGRVSRELSVVDDFMIESAAKAASQRPAMPRLSRSLEELASQNGFNLLVDDDRANLQNFVKQLKQSAPVMHISFASDPPPNFLVKLITWLRAEIDPRLILKIGLQPSIAAGCVLRTRNKYFDFSLRQHLESKTNLLAEQINRMGSKT